MKKKLENWEIEQMYKDADLNNDGKIFNDELYYFLRNEGLNVSMEQVDKYVRVYD